MSKGQYIISENSASLALRGQERTSALPAYFSKVCSKVNRKSFGKFTSYDSLPGLAHEYEDRKQEESFMPGRQQQQRRDSVTKGEMPPIFFFLFQHVCEI